MRDAPENDLPPRYRRREDGAIEFQFEKDDDESWRWIAAPIQMVGESRDGSDAGWKVVIEARNRLGQTKRLSIPRALFAGNLDEVARLFLDHGVDVATDRDGKKALAWLLQRGRADRILTSVSRLGWTSSELESFIAGPDRVIGAETVVYEAAHVPALVDAMRSKGSLELWRSSVAHYAIDNPPLIFAISQALSGPLLELMAADGGGFNLRGPSSRGKSRVLFAAASVWGAPGFVSTWRTTDNALEWLCAAANGTILLLDEIGQGDSRKAGEIAYMIANGEAKARANTQGGARRRANWRTTMLSSGELSLSDKIREAGGRVRAGQEVRVLDLPVTDYEYGCFGDLHDHADGGAFADAVKAAAAANYGHAGPAFVERIIQHPDAVRRLVERHRKYFVEKAREQIGEDKIDGQVARALDRFALVAAAGEIASSDDLLGDGSGALGSITGWPDNLAMDAVLDIAARWLLQRGDVGATEKRQAIAQVREYLTRYGDTRFQRQGIDVFEGHDRAGFRDDAYFYVMPEIWRNQVVTGLDPKTAAKDLEAAGFLERGEGRNRQARLPWSVAGGARGSIRSPPGSSRMSPGSPSKNQDRLF